MSPTLREWFFLKNGRLNFKPNVRKDRNVIFCHDDQIEKQAQTSIEKSFTIGEPVKMMIYGNWGVGKTHAVHHIAWWLEQHTELKTKTIFVEVGDITKKSKFDVLVRPFLDQIGLEEILRLAGMYQLKTGNSLVEGLKELGVGTEIANSLHKMAMTPPGSTPLASTLQAFEYLKGGLFKDIDAGGVTLRLEQSSDFYEVLVTMGHLFKSVDDTNLIFIADEAAKLEDVEGDDATSAHWEAMNKLIYDDENIYFGFIYTIGASSERNLPRVLTHPQIRNRLGKQNLIELKTFNEKETEEFLNRLVESFVDKEAVEALAKAGELGSDYDPKIYPFTKKGYARFIDYWKRNQENATPRDITDQMNDAAFVALKSEERLIGENALKSAGL